MINKKPDVGFEDIVEAQKTLTYHKQSFVSTLYRFWLDEPIRETSYYRELIQTLLTATEDDIVEIIISNGGGYLETAVNIITAIRSSQAHVHGVIMSECHSAGSMIALACHSVHVTPHSNMMVHYASGGCVGRFDDVVSQAEHMRKRLAKIIEDYYEGFLSPEEITDVIEGRCGDKWFDADEISARLEQREVYMEEKAERLEREAEEELEEQTKPKRKSRKKKES